MKNRHDKLAEIATSLTQETQTKETLKETCEELKVLHTFLYVAYLISCCVNEKSES